MNNPAFLARLTDLQNPAADFFAAILTFLGNEEFYFLIIPLIYWCISKKTGFSLFYIFLLSVYVNSLLKITYAVQRPVGVEGVNSLYVSSAEVGSHYPYDSFPSGHAQGSATLWGYLAAVIRRPAFTVFAALLILLISFSRLYTGLHWPSDVVIGILLGILFVAGGIFIQSRISAVPAVLKWLLIFIIPFLLIVFLPANEGYQYAGIVLGGTTGYILQETYINMKIDTGFLRKGIAFLLGISVTFGLQTGLKVMFPEMLIFDFIRYGTVGIWITFAAPLLFVKLNVYRQTRAVHIP